MDDLNVGPSRPLAYGPSAPRAEVHWEWGIITGTLYFDREATAIAAADAAWISRLGVFLPPPFDVIVVLYATYIGVSAAIALTVGQCVEVKTDLQASSYDGGWCV